MKYQKLRLKIRQIYENRVKKIEKGFLLRSHFIYKTY